MSHHGNNLPPFNPEQMNDVIKNAFTEPNLLNELHKANPIPLGSIGTYPNGKLNESDKGGFHYAITVDINSVIVNFGTPVQWIGLTKKEAHQLAIALIEKAQSL